MCTVGVTVLERQSSFHCLHMKPSSLKLRLEGRKKLQLPRADAYSSGRYRPHNVVKLHKFDLLPVVMAYYIVVTSDSHKFDRSNVLERSSVVELHSKILGRAVRSDGGEGCVWRPLHCLRHRLERHNPVQPSAH